MTQKIVSFSALKQVIRNTCQVLTISAVQFLITRIVYKIFRNLSGQCCHRPSSLRVIYRQSLFIAVASALLLERPVLVSLLDQSIDGRAFSRNLPHGRLDRRSIISQAATVDEPVRTCGRASGAASQIITFF